MFVETETGFSNTFYYEMAVRDLLRQFGDDTLDIVERTIEALETTGPETTLEIWYELRCTLIRTLPAPTSCTVQ